MSIPIGIQDLGGAMPQTYQFISLDPNTAIDAWPVAEEPLTGSRAKNTVYDPETAIGYVFKKPKPGREAQIWSELIASYIGGDLLGWSIQHVAISQRGGIFGNLIGYIYQIDGDEFTEGWSFCREINENYDVDKGEDHTLPLLLEVGASLERDGLPQGEFAAFWARAFAFDSLISNTDRHAENWAVIKSGDVRRMAPLYDSATSLGCEIDDASLDANWFDPSGMLKDDVLARYLSRGRHHVRLAVPGRRGTPFEEICRAFLAEAPDQRGVFEAVADLDLDPIEGLLTDICALEGVPAPYRMSANRVIHIQSLLISGRERIRNILK